MNFLPTELNITDYMQSLSDKLMDDDCHVFIDTNILSQLYKLNDKARSEFFSWVKTIETRFHIPNWVVMEYNKRVKSRQLKDYVGELDKFKSVKKELINLQRFSWGYVDDDILQGSNYHRDTKKFQDDFKLIVDNYNCISNVITKKISDRLKKVEQEIIDALTDYIVDTDIYTIIQNVQQSAAIRFENRIPPGYGDDHKDTNRFGDLVIWQELLDCCKRNNWTKAILISRDLKDQYFKPDNQLKDGSKIQEEEKIGIAYDSLVYEFKLVTGHDDFLLIDFITLVQLLSKNYTDLAFSFQMVSHDIVDATEESDNELLQTRPEITGENNQLPVNPREPNDEDAATLEYKKNAMQDYLYIEGCDNEEIKICINRLKSHNWYIQNNAVESLNVILAKDWNNNIENRSNFFVIGRNILQSADGNAFESVRFIKDMSKILESKSKFLKKAIIDGCLFEVFFDSHGELRKKGFKGYYFSDVVENAKECLGNDAFTFINNELSKVTDHFVPVVDGDIDYQFQFCLNEDAYTIQSLTINDKDCSDSFSRPNATKFADKDDITHSLSLYYAIPENKIHVSGIPEELTSLRYIKRENNN